MAPWADHEKNVCARERRTISSLVMVPGAVLVLIKSSVPGGAGRPPVALRGSSLLRSLQHADGNGERPKGHETRGRHGRERRRVGRCVQRTTAQHRPADLRPTARSRGSYARMLPFESRTCAAGWPGKQAAVERTDPAVGTARQLRGVHPRARSCVERKALDRRRGRMRAASCRPGATSPRGPNGRETGRRWLYARGGSTPPARAPRTPRPRPRTRRGSRRRPAARSPSAGRRCPGAGRGSRRATSSPGRRSARGTRSCRS